jgi:phospholipid/cholesterol/gamma-HCH transport system permease protein
MQAFYGATFLEAVGPVVGVGLFRNVAPLMTGFVMTGLFAARVTPDLFRRSPLEPQPDDAADHSRRGAKPTIRIVMPVAETDPFRLAAARIGAAMLTGPILALWGASVGTVIGWLVSLQVLRVPTTVFVMKCFEMVWGRDILALVLKGACFGFAAALFSCHEIVRGTARPGLAAVRAACLGGLAILLLNSTFYVFFYMAGPPFGPTVLKPPVS